MLRPRTAKSLWSIAAAIPFSVMLGIAFYLNSVELDEGRSERMTERARIAASFIDLRLERLLNLTRFCASDPAIVTRMDPTSFLENCGRYAKILDAWVVVVALGDVHQQVFNTRTDAPTVLPSYPRTSEKAQLLALESKSRATGEPGIAEVFTGKVYPGGIISTGQWLRLSDGREAMLYVGISSRAISEQLASLAVEGTTILTLVDPSGRIVARSKDIDEYIFTPAPDWLLAGKNEGTKLAVAGPQKIGGIWDAGFRPLTVASGWIAVAVQPVSGHPWLWDFFSLKTLLVLAGVGGSGLIVWLYGFRSRSLQKVLASERARRLAEEQNQDKSKLLATFAHDVRAPLVSMIGSLSVMEESKAAALEYLPAAQSSAQALLQLVDDILELSFLGSGEFALQPSPVDLRALANDLLAGVRLEAESKDLTLKFECDPALPLTVELDRLRLQQVLRNLLTNAIKYTEKGGVTLKIMSDTIRNSTVGVTFAVTDTGVGIAEADIGGIFREFGRLDRPIDQRETGMGLGLAICKRILKAMDAELTVDSRVGTGSTFSFRIQVAVPRSVGSEVGAHPLSGLTILYAEDEPIIRRLTARQLRDAGATVIEAENGQQALDCLQSYVPDLFLLDIQMPVMDGVETISRLNAMGSDRRYPVFVLTSYISGPAVAEARSLGADEVFTKPVQIHPLAAAVRARRGDSGAHTPSIGGRAEEESEESLLSDNFGILARSGSSSMLDKNVEEFEAQMRAEFTQLEAKIEAGDFLAVRTIAHRCLGVFLVFGAQELAKRMKDMENATDLREQAVIAGQTPGLALLLERTVQRMRTWQA